MTFDRFRRAPTQPLLSFLAVALLSATALSWLGWLLVRQDGALELQRQQERLDQSADRAAGALQLALAELQERVAAGAAPDPLPSSVIKVAFRAQEVMVQPLGAILYVPVLPAAVHVDAFADGERAEFADRDSTRAGRIYEALARSSVTAIRAGALARLARVQRKGRDTRAALRTYDALAAEHAAVEGLPAALVARAGRASIFEEAGHTAALKEEAAVMQRALDRGVWPITRSQYEFYLAKTAAWLGTDRRADESALARSEIVEWLWQNRALADGSHRQAVSVPHGSAFVVSRGGPSGLDALIVSPDYFAQRCATSIGSGLHCGFSDAEGRVVHGGILPKLEAVRTASAANGLPWTLHVFAEAHPPAASPRRRLLITTFAIVGLVLALGWYSIARAMSRELRVSRLQADFVAAVSHEFRSPLTSLSHIAEMLAEDRFASDEMKRGSYDVLVRETDRLRRLVENLLDFGRFEAGLPAFRFERLDITSLVRTVVEDFRQNAVAAGYTIELLSPADAISATADRDALARALWNLLDNAVKYSPEKRVVWVEVRREGGRVTIAVRDQGLGIPASEQRDIFDCFVRGAESKARRIKGTGIGLAMVRQIVLAHRGDIRVDSEPGSGSRFTVVLNAEGAPA